MDKKQAYHYSLYLNMIGEGRVKVIRQDDKYSVVNADTEEPVAWITTEHGHHIPLNKAGEAIAGCGGTMVGKEFKSASSTNTREGATTRKMSDIEAKEAARLAKRAERAKERARRVGTKEESDTLMGGAEVPETYEGKGSKALAAKMNTPEMKAASSGAKKVGQAYYDNGRKGATFDNKYELASYTEHTEAHVQMVADKAQEAVAAIEEFTNKNPNYGKIDRKELQVAALLHDTGMDGGTYMGFDDNTYRKKDKQGNLTEEHDYGNDQRKAHPMNSAIHVLENSEAIKKLGLDPALVAMDVLGHSKSTSGINDLESKKDWTEAINRLQANVDLYNKKHPDKKIDFDISALADTSKKDSDGNYIFNDEQLAKTRSLTAALRIGDANRDYVDPPMTQGGYEVKIESFYDPKTALTLEDEVAQCRCTALGAGKDGSDLVFGKDEGKGYIDRAEQGFSRQAFVGEGNIATMNCSLNNGRVCEDFEVKGSDFPIMTAQAIGERFGEMATMNGIPSMATIRIKKDARIKSMSEAEKEEFKGKYMQMLNKQKRHWADKYQREVDLDIKLEFVD